MVHFGGRVQVPAVQVCPIGQALPQTPQFAGSVWKDMGSTQFLPQTTWFLSHAMPHTPIAHVAWPNAAGAGQTWPHVPQFSVLVVVSRQAWPQSVVPFAQPASGPPSTGRLGFWHTPPEHHPPGSHAWLHAPQW